MKIFRKPLINAAVTSIISIFYAFIFVLTSGHIEFERTLNHANTLNSPFWNTWSAFLKQGNAKYIGFERPFVFYRNAHVPCCISLVYRSDCGFNICR